MPVSADNPLRDLHEQAEAEFQKYGQIDIVATFGEPQAEYSAVRKSAGIVDLPYRGVLEVTGKDRLDFLNRFLTNQTFDKDAKTPMPAGTGVYAFLLNNKGRVVADFNVLELGDRTLLETDARLIEPARAMLDKYVFREDVKFKSLLESIHEFALHGPRAADVLTAAGAAMPAASANAAVEPSPAAGAATASAVGSSPATSAAAAGMADRGESLTPAPASLPAPPSPPAPASPPAPLSPPPLSTLPPMSSIQTTILGAAAIVWRDDVCGVPGFHVLLSPAEARRVWVNLIAGTANPRDPGKRVLRPFGWAIFNAARIEAGRPLFGIDFDDSVLPAETGQVERAVSFTKGCYLGQEIVARMHARGQVARQVVGIRVKGDAAIPDPLPIAGAPVFDSQQNQVGAVTSSTVSPILSGAAICLAMVKRAFTPIGSEVMIPADGAIRNAQVVALPFVALPVAGQAVVGR